MPSSICTIFTLAQDSLTIRSSLPLTIAHPHSRESTQQQQHVDQNNASMELINSVTGTDEEGRSRQRILTFAARRPTVIYSSNKKLLYSNLNLKEVSDMCLCNSAAFLDSLFWSKSSLLPLNSLSPLLWFSVIKRPAQDHLGEEAAREEKQAMEKIAATLASLTAKKTAMHKYGQLLWAAVGKGSVIK
ncbi:hypothetical protein HYC85_021769 [Camellia sinensis]|uniref:Uncharacterized protein n=1 Tax=Camellia sinensis TaxID=4442 RepID=A0A7J7GII4_CAMSI|nr:hypothetical protein HYC85_021769 [Camellia sinensis]